MRVGVLEGQTDLTGTEVEADAEGGLEAEVEELRLRYMAHEGRTAKKVPMPDEGTVLQGHGKMTDVPFKRSLISSARLALTWRWLPVHVCLRRSVLVHHWWWTSRKLHCLMRANGRSKLNAL